MDHDVELRFQKVKTELEKKFGEGMDVQSILFLIGVNELGVGYREFSKSEKTDVLHIAVCTLLEPYGYYQFEKRDEENWPHFKLIKELPAINDREQQHLIKEAMTDYFIQNEYVSLAEK
ncbi:MAG: hypothetical protein KC454_00650 [Flavobacteriales bacterium]|nr:hypothetical protein [Flavobacteriales bacterium]